jgi:hypothetical protein
MPSSLTSKEKQSAAFNYLGNRARSAHLDDNGLEVNSLCATALVQFTKLANDGKLHISLADVAWCHIFPLYWLIDDYMLRLVQRSHEAIQKTGRADEWIYVLLKDYCNLLYEPLGDISSEISHFKSLSFDKFDTLNTCEATILLSHVVELIWYRTVQQGEWESLIAQWIANSPTPHKVALTELRDRLTLQTGLAAPSPRHPARPLTSAASLPGPLKFGGIWLRLLHNDAHSLDDALKELNATVEPDSHVARLLWDLHHTNRFQGQFGEPQEVGLARRRLFTSSSPLLTFNEFREAALSEAQGRVFRRNEVEGAYERFSVFRLAMLCEISALRLWD